MNCEQSQLLVDSFVEAELDQRMAAEVSAHIAVCATCGASYEALLRERAILRQYLQEIDCAPNLWEKVNEGIVQPHRVSINDWFYRLFTPPLKSARVRVGFASLFAIAIVWVTIDALRHTKTPQRDPDHIVSQDQNANRVQSNTSDNIAANGRQSNEFRAGVSSRRKQQRRVQVADPIRTAEQRYFAAIYVLSRDLAQHRKQLDPTAVEQLERTLAKLNLTIAATRRAAYADPKNPVVVQYLMTAYARKVEALRQFVAV